MISSYCKANSTAAFEWISVVSNTSTGHSSGLISNGISVPPYNSFSTRENLSFVNIYDKANATAAFEWINVVSNTGTGHSSGLISNGISVSPYKLI